MQEQSTKISQTRIWETRLKAEKATRQQTSIKGEGARGRLKVTQGDSGARRRQSGDGRSEKRRQQRQGLPIITHRANRRDKTANCLFFVHA